MYEELNTITIPPYGVGTSTIYQRRHIYSCPFHITCDNHFYMNVLDYARWKGFTGITQTCHQRLVSHKELKEYLHHKVVNAGDAQPKVMCFKEPIVDVNKMWVGTWEES